MRRKVLLLLPVLLLAGACSRDPKAQAQRYLENGNKFFARDKFKEASIMYRRAILKDQRFGEAYYRLGLTDLKLQAYGESVKMLRRAVELQPNNTDAATKLADLFLVAATQDRAHTKELLKEVEDLAKGLLAQNPESYDAQRLQGQLKLLSGDPKASIEAFEKANRIKPFQPDLSLTYFQALTLEGRTADAEKLAREIFVRDKTFTPMYDVLYLQFVKADKINDAEAVLKLKAENNPTQAGNLLQLAGHYYIQKRNAEMDAVMKRVTDEKVYPQGHLIAGDFYFYRIRQYDRAETEYNEAMKANPKDKAVYQKRLVELYAMSNRGNDANNLLETILKDNPKDSDAIGMRAALLLSTGNRDQVSMAVNDLQSLVTKTPNNHLLRFNLGRGLIAKGEIEQGRIQLEEAIKLRPDFLQAREVLARVYLSKNDPARALKEADTILSVDKNNPGAHLIRSSALLSLGDPQSRDKAREELDLISKRFPQNPDARYQAGFLAFQDKDFKKAEQVFQQLFKDNPADLRGLIGICELLVQQNRTPEAIQAVDKALAVDPNKRQLHIMKANLLVRSNQFDPAIAIYQRMANAEPGSAELWFYLGSAHRLKGDMNAALTAFQRASQAAPNDSNSLLQIGLLMEGTGKRDQAKPVYEQILKLQPDNPVALNNLAYIKAEEGTDLDQALSMAQRARQKFPGAHEISDTLGWIYIKKNLAEDAIRVLDELVKTAPQNPTFRYHLAMALSQKGDRPRARKELEEALRNKPSTEIEKQIRSMLSTI